MSIIFKNFSLSETSGSVAKTNLAGLKDCTPNCPPDCPDCGQINFKKKPATDVYESYEKTRKKKRNIALLTGFGVLAASAGAVFGLGKLYNSKWIAEMSDGWIKTSLENVSRGCNNACRFVKDKAISGWEWVKNIGKK